MLTTESTLATDSRGGKAVTQSFAGRKWVVRYPGSTTRTRVSSRKVTVVRGLSSMRKVACEPQSQVVEVGVEVQLQFEGQLLQPEVMQALAGLGARSNIPKRRKIPRTGERRRVVFSIATSFLNHDRIYFQTCTTKKE
jgi:hypothetical protein